MQTAELSGPTQRTGARIFRQDINGLRAIAVLAVVLYHYGVAPFWGGFVGVDIFFVISGYLMSQVIASRLDGGQFSLVSFYWARFSRIVPALCLMISTVMLFGWIYVEPLAYRNLSLDAASSLLFYSNILYYLLGGYFGGTAEKNWLLHTWSLSVEWQFYIFYPLLLIGLQYCKPQSKRAFAIVILLVLSLVLCIGLTYLKPTAAFFLLPTRCWELLGGGVVFFSAKHFRRLATTYTESVGLFLIVASCILFDKFSVWPGYLAALPTVGAMLLIISDRGRASMLRAAPFQIIGSCSYSIYLWHWPLIAGATYFGFLGSFATVPILLVTTVLLGFGSFYFVEKPSEHILRQANRSMLRGATLGGVVGISAIGLLIGAFGGVPSRASNVVEITATIDARQSWDFPQKDCEGFLSANQIRTCRVGTGDNSPSLIIGDSLAQEWYSRYRRLAESKTIAPIVFATRAGCLPIVGIERIEPGHKCGKFAEDAFELAKSGSFARVMFIAHWTAYFGSLSQPPGIAICKKELFGCVRYTDPRELLDILYKAFDFQLRAISQSGSKLIIVLPFPDPGFSVPDEVARREFENRAITDLKEMSLERFLLNQGPVRNALSSIATKNGAQLVDPASFMCSNIACPLLDASGRSLYKDDIHLTPAAVENSYSFLDRYLGE